jgi:ribosome biogenesis GTPase
MSNFTSLGRLGWQAYFQQQLSLDEWDKTIPARVIEQYKSEITVSTGSDTFNIALFATMPEMIVGDWLILDSQQHILRLLDRKTCFSRKAAGSKLKKQLIAANVDVAFIMSSMNDDFNLNRLERFLSLVNDSGAEPVVLLSKCDQSATPESFVNQVQQLDPFLMVEAVNCLDRESVNKLSPWIKEGTTIAALGSSGVGKSTLVNTLLGEYRQSTADIREYDDKGRHTTTRRSLIALDSGGVILDTPGMREIQLADCKVGIAATFSDIVIFSEQCKFSDCQHQNEPGCAVQEAIKSGEIDQRRLNNYLKLLREESLNSASRFERRANDKALSKFCKKTQSQAQEFKRR